MNPSELLKRCKEALPDLPWAIQGHEGEEMVFADLGGGRRITCACRSYGLLGEYCQVSSKITDTGRGGPTFCHAAFSADTALEGCVAMVLGVVTRDIRGKLHMEEARLFSMRACVDAIG